MSRNPLVIFPLLVILCALPAAGCDEDAPGPSATATVTPAGGQVALPDGTASLTFPPGAVAGEVEVTLQEVADPGVQGLSTALYELGPAGVQFSAPVVLTVRVAAGIATEGIYLARVVGTQATRVEGSTFNAGTRELSAPLTSFSRYGGVVPASLESCQDCVAAQCPSQLQACEDAPACNATLGCIDNCVGAGGAGDSCIDGCVASNPGGKTLFEAMAACAEQQCPDCTDAPPPPDECRECLEAKCPSQMQACEADPDCDALMGCIEDCTTGGGSPSTCYDSCTAQHPDGTDLMGDLGDCLEAQCPACQGEQADLPSVSFRGTLYVHPEDSLEGANTVWGLEGRVTGATSTDDGEFNTRTAVDSLGNIGAEYAAKVCSDLVSLGYEDWFLPSRDELDVIHKSRNAIGGFFDVWYWSSTEEGDPEFQANRAWIQNFQDGFSHAISKGLLGRVRCVRRNP